MARNAVIISREDAVTLYSLFAIIKHGETTFALNQGNSFMQYVLNGANRKEVTEAFERLKDKMSPDDTPDPAPAGE